ncbi:MAG: methylenetetrahydrofolate reductase [NAD(P)H] [Planctomycetota bacterium]|nr:MAG: methylenetetrahydrofolate reductase [NAD(P)H] [Planctomycetota bacterium]REJ96833.1 MAG: methylenetetrahydrofolate reductase [NAD(P)H] [Planctomycetota bacterium]REK24022.1 MAG: methylenetetrahydrofolate reductase [NAD(P)H] [Planctomycetota bacterium]REK39353.1 MAG: methylenetetrahydrofolate reductase [NAD(P)H] [Planctomycetota bacterium]
MNIGAAYGPGKFGLSFELFPPKTDAGETALFRHVDTLIEFEPSFITCTYGAGGSTRDKTLSIISQVHERYQLPVASHLTCVGATADELRTYLQEAQSRGIGNIVALRGDPPQGETEFKPVAGGFRFAVDLVEMIDAEFSELGIAVAGYPETHQEATSPAADLENLKRKVDAGGDVVITQLFYDNADFFRFRDSCDALGIDAPLVPGLLPVISFKQIERIASLCGARLPDDFREALAACGDDAAAQVDVGVEFASRQVQELLDAGVPGIHFYVLNRSEATARVLREVHRAS